MAVLHRATLEPGKAELVGSWLDARGGGSGSQTDGAAELLAAYRFDDPDGQVGVEAFVVRRGGRLLHVPLTYRSAPLADAEEALVGRMRHSVLGERWVYDAGADPVAVACFERALRGEQDQAPIEVYDGAVLVERRDPSVRLRLEEGADRSGRMRLVEALDADAEVPTDSARLLVAPVDETILGARGEAVVAYLA
ncbi:MAG: maltokinase N-terminal cap-like domain-containing protein [Marmoricola sp.]